MPALTSAKLRFEHDYYSSVAPTDLEIRVSKQVRPEKESIEEILGYQVDVKKISVKKIMKA